jgi:DNA-binding MarR family transcriptional regulator
MERKKLSATLGYRLARVCKAHRVRAHARLEELGLHGGQQFVLCALWNEEGISHSELADWLHVHPATVTNALKRMERAGFVERRADPQDQRVSRVYLTDAGHKIQDAVERVWAELEANAFEGFSEEERETLQGLLERVLENLREKE